MIYATGRDVTEGQRAQEQLRSSERFLDSVLENLRNMVFVKDAEELRFVCFNRAGEKLIGSPREELIGKNDHDLFPNKGARARRRGQQVVRKGASAMNSPACSAAQNGCTASATWALENRAINPCS